MKRFVLQTVEIFFTLFAKEASQLFKKLFLNWILPSILDGEVSFHLCSCAIFIDN